MRVFYIFKIKDEFKYLYKNNESTLYNIIKQIIILAGNIRSLITLYSANFLYAMKTPVKA